MLHRFWEGRKKNWHEFWEEFKKDLHQLVSVRPCICGHYALGHVASSVGGACLWPDCKCLGWGKSIEETA